MSENQIFLAYQKPKCASLSLTDFLLDLEKPMLLTEIQYIAKQLLNSLHFLHSKGIFHLEISPDNIIVLENTEGQHD